MSKRKFTTCSRTTLLALVLHYHLLAAWGGSHQPVAGDRETLLALSVSKEWSAPRQLWNITSSPDDHCRWRGVTCAAGGGGVVTELAMPNFSLAGTVPATVCALKNLTRLDLSDNKLAGAVPAAALYACASLRFLDLSNNHFSGPLPIDFISKARLEHLNLSTNSFAGEVPAAVARLTALKSLLLDTNRFTGAYPAAGISELAGLEVLTLGYNAFAPGPVPAEFAQLTNLTYLRMDRMHLTGEIPEAFSSLTKLKVLSLSSNNLTGSIPAWVLQHAKLQSIYLFENSLSGELPRNVTAANLIVLDLSSNNLTGEIPDDFCRLKNLTSLVLYNNQFTGEAASGLNLTMFCGNQPRGMITFFALLAGIVLVGSTGVACLLFRRRKVEQEATACWKMEAFTTLDFSVQDVLDNLGDDNVIGEGASGKVYRMCFVAGGRYVAVKRICNSGPLREREREREFNAEIKVLRSMRQNNILELLGYIHTEQEMFLVLEHMENGGLDRWLHPRHDRNGAPAALLDWPRRLSVAIDAAKGLSYMHHDCGTPIVHRDIKPQNILLDHNFRAKIADFGLALFLPGPGQSVSASIFGGTPGYMAPEILSGEVNEKVDVYSFGVLLLELITGKPPIDNAANIGLVEWAHGRQRGDDFVDVGIRDAAYVNQIIERIFVLGLRCTMKEPRERPWMNEVLHYLVHQVELFNHEYM